MISVSWKEHPLTIHICAVQFFHKRGTHTQRAWLNNCIVIFVRLKSIWSSVLFHVSSFLVSPAFHHDTSSSSFNTQEHAAQSVQQEQLREHPVHHAHLQATSVDKLRHQESLLHENPHSGGNPRTTTPTGYTWSGRD